MTTADLPAALREAIVRISQTEHLLVAMDFDGTISPLVSRAEDARPLPASSAALEALSRLKSTTTALVSGRALASLRVVASPGEQTLLVGSHGAEQWLGPDSPGLTLTDSQQETLRYAQACVEEVAQRYPGLHAEIKPAGVVLHYREASPEHGEEAVTAVRLALESREGLFITEGKMVLEISVLNANKGESLTLLRDFCAATAVIFAGDDVTDEHGFAVLAPGDVGIKVGEGESAAQFRIATPQQLPAVLELLLEQRSGTS